MHNPFHILAFLILIIYSSLSHSAIYIVGQGSPDCTHADLPNALISASGDPDLDEVRLSNQGMSYTNISAFITAQSITIKGGYDTCNDALNDTPSPNGQTNLQGDAAAPVLLFTNLSGIPYDLLLQRLVIHNGSGSALSSNHGGGVSVHGYFDLTIKDSEIYNNIATGNGGGIYLADTNATSGGDPSLELENTHIHHNQAVDGAGIYFDRIWSDINAQLTFTGDNQISHNTASGDGGGLFINGTVTADTSTHWHEIRTHDQTGEIRLEYNQASLGGALYFQSYVDWTLYYGGQLFMNHNAADYGAALYMDWDSRLTSFGSELNYNVSTNNIVYATGGSRWTDQTLVFNHNTSDQDGILLALGNHYLGGTFCANTLNNDTFALIRLYNSSLSLRSGLVCQNSGGDALFSLQSSQNDSSHIYIAGSTLADNQKQDLSLLSSAVEIEDSDNTYSLYANIFWNTALETLTTDASNLPVFSNGCSIANETASMSAFNGMIALDPLFQNPVQLNYRTVAGSPAIDQCANGVTTANLDSFDDLDGNTRGQDNPTISDAAGLYDMGAYEITHDRLFRDSFE